MPPRTFTTPDLVVTPRKLDTFHTWLMNNGRMEGTADLYVKLVTYCARDAAGPTARLVGDLAPKTKRTNLAALQAWATFEEDPNLTVALNKVRLPPANRVTPKIELDYDDWRRLVIGISSDSKTRPAVRALILVMALRGLRSADALRLRRKDVKGALRTGTLTYQAKGSKWQEVDAEALTPALTALMDEDGPWEVAIDLVVGSRCRSTGMGRRRAAARVLDRHLRRIADGLEIEGVHPHRLRRTYATNYVKMLVGDPQAMIKLQKHMGWATMATAVEYVDHVSKDELARLGNSMISDLLAGAPPRRKK